METKQKLNAVMKRIQAILEEEDVAGVVVLTAPCKEVVEEYDDFVTIRFSHISPSYSVAKTVDQLCCPEHGVVKAIAIDMKIDHTNPDAGYQRAIKTMSMFSKLGTAANKISNESEAILKATEAGLKKLIKGEKASTINPNQPN